MEGVLLVLVGGTPWELIPRGLGVSGMTCWRRHRDWTSAGVWDDAWRALLDELGEKGLLDWSRAAADSFSSPAKKGATDSDPIPPTEAGRVRKPTS